MSHRFTLDALNELIAARRDAELGLRICAEHVRESRLRALVLSHLQICAQALQELQSLVRLLGGGDRAADPGFSLSAPPLVGFTHSSCL